VSKSTTTYWNALDAAGRVRWTAVAGLEGMAEQLTLAADPETGDYTRLTRFHPGTDTSHLGGKVHDYPEEVFVVSGRLYDAAFDLWLEAGHYASRPPGELHGPFRTDDGCVVLEVSHPGQRRAEVEASLARTPPPPYYAVVFANVRSAADPEGYGATAGRMVELASSMPGFLGIESVRAADGAGITVSYWESEAAIREWKAEAEHREARRLGRERWYAGFELRVCRVERAYGFREALASQRRDGS
jgi:heme-degrading monooxygenase HmoA